MEYTLIELNFTLRQTVEEYIEVYINGIFFFSVKKQSESIISGSF